MTAALAAGRHELVRRIPLAQGWELTTGGGRVIPARVPGTVASALRERNAWRFGDGVRFDTAEHTFRCRFEAAPAEAGEEIVLDIGGIATVAEVSLNGEPIVSSTSMFASHRVDVTRLLGERNELVIVCRPLSDFLREGKSRVPAARWRTRVVADPQLRWARTTLLGRAPGFAPEPEPVGPWRPVTLVRRAGLCLENVMRGIDLQDSTGVVRFEARVRILDDRHGPVSGRFLVGDHAAPLEFADGNIAAAVRVPNVRRWWPHTHGHPYLYPVRCEIQLEDGSIAAFDHTPAGFRTIQFSDGFEVNGRRVFARGVVWTPPDPVALYASPERIRDRLLRLRDAGFNVIRLAGTMVYEDGAFHQICDELGLLVWQDLMFANMDYPFEDAEFHQTARAEAAAELARVSLHASTALICGNSEIEQQAAMLGLDPSIARAPFFAQELPRIAESLCPGVPYLPSAPCGGDLAFRTRAGVANYFGVGAYLRPLEDARRAGVRFASECLAFANVPEPETIEKMMRAVRGGISPTHPAWKRAAPRDAGTGWDFEDVRDHYLKLLYAMDPAALRYHDPARYWELSRMASAEVMAEVFGEWRRAESPNHGGIVLWAADLEPGAGWGILDASGTPKAAYWFLKRALAPRAVWTTDEGLDGVDIHVANDCAESMEAVLRVALYRHGEQRVGESERRIHVSPGETVTFGVEEILGRFVDAAWAYRFGPPGHDVIAVSLRETSGDAPFAQAFRFLAARHLERIDVGLSAHADAVTDAAIEVTLTSRRFAWGVRAAAPGWIADDAYFGIEPGGRRRIKMTRSTGAPAPANINVTAINADGRVKAAIGRGG